MEVDFGSKLPFPRGGTVQNYKICCHHVVSRGKGAHPGGVDGIAGEGL